MTLRWSIIQPIEAFSLDTVPMERLRGWPTRDMNQRGYLTVAMSVVWTEESSSQVSWDILTWLGWRNDLADATSLRQSAIDVSNGRDRR